MKDIVSNNIIFIKSIGIWSLFLIALIKTLELFINNNFILVIISPGFIIYGFFFIII